MAVLSYTASDINRLLGKINAFDTTKVAENTEQIASNTAADAEFRAMVEANYATKAELNSLNIPSVDGLATVDYVDEKVDSISIPSVNGLVTEEEMTNYVNERLEEIVIPTTDGYATEDYVNAQIAAIEMPDTDGLATEDYVDTLVGEVSDRIPTLVGYATEEYVENHIPALDEYAKTADVNAAIAAIQMPSVDGLATTEYVDEKVATLTGVDASTAETIAAIQTALNENTEGDATVKDVLEAAIATKVSTETYEAGVAELNDKIDAIEVPSLDGYATEDYVNTQIANAAIGEDTNVYATMDYVDEQIEAAISELDIPVMPDLSEYAKTEDVETMVADAVDGVEIPSLEGYATEQFVIDSIPALDDYAKTEDVTVAMATKVSTETYEAGVAELNSKIDAIEEDYATKQYVTEQIAAAAVGEDSNVYATMQYVDDAINNIQMPSVDGLASTEYVDEKVATLTGVDASTAETIQAIQTALAANTEGDASVKEVLEAAIAQKVDIEDYNSGIAAVANAIPSLDGLASTQYVDDKFDTIVIPEMPDLSEYAKTEDVEAMVADAVTQFPSLENYATKDDVADAINAIDIPKLDGYATEEYVNTQIANAAIGEDTNVYATVDYVDERIAGIEQPDLSAYVTNDALTATIAGLNIPSVEGLATEAYVNSQIEGIVFPEPNLDGYATEQYVDDKIAEIPATDLTGYATEQYVDDKIAEIPATDLSEYATISYVNEQIAEIPATDLSEYATISYVNEQIAVLTGVDASTAETIQAIQTALTTNTEGDATVKELLEAAIAAKVDSETYEEAITYLNDKVDAINVPSLEGYATEAYVNSQIEGIVFPEPNLDGYATEQYVDDKIAEIPATDLTGYATEAYVTAAIDGLASTEYVDEVLEEKVDSDDYQTQISLLAAEDTRLETDKADRSDLEGYVPVAALEAAKADYNAQILSLKKIVGDLGGDVTYDAYDKNELSQYLAYNGTVMLMADVIVPANEGYFYYGAGTNASNKVKFALNGHTVESTGRDGFALITMRGTNEFHFSGAGTLHNTSTENNTETIKHPVLLVMGGVATLGAAGNESLFFTTDSNDPVIVVEGGSAVIKGGVYSSANTCTIFANGNGSVEISGGVFKSTASAENLLNTEGDGNITVTGGKFYDFNPAGNGETHCFVPYEDVEENGETTRVLQDAAYTYSITETGVEEEGVNHTVYEVKKTARQ